MKKIALAFLLLITGNVRAEPVRVDVRKQDCIRLLFQSADYVPGLSATGQEVAPADLNDDANIPLPDFKNMTLPIYLNLKRDFPFLESDLDAGFLPVARVDFRDGQIFVNDTLVSKEGANALKKACREGLKEENIDKNNLTPVQ
ncbi:MAG: hypothetical protein J5787_07935 [Alphaproteobacteria bacterium]|nr:hypothetical protein [Alphaproteobacteria bacterium]MBO4643105.1 hypothetical protein [Alphaproteobacteria bacterium]